MLSYKYLYFTRNRVYCGRLRANRYSLLQSTNWPLFQSNTRRIQHIIIFIVFIVASSLLKQWILLDYSSFNFHLCQPRTKIFGNISIGSSSYFRSTETSLIYLEACQRKGFILCRLLCFNDLGILWSFRWIAYNYSWRKSFN